VWMYVGIGFVVVWIVALAIFLPHPTNPLENTGISTPADFNWSLVDLNDQPVPFSKYKGKTVFLNLWATWCPPCVRELPSIEKLAREPKLRDKNIAFLCVSLDKSTDVVRQFFGEIKVPMTILRATSTPQVFANAALPSTFIIASDGRIAAFVEGADDWSVPHVVEFLESLASAPAPAPAK
jgi:thiol-disulfide isomerase/thioredoxin